MSLKWSDDFLVGHATIDRQHQELVRAFNELLDACKAGKGKDQVAQLLDFLDGYVVFHFKAEEALMLQHRYPAAAEHRAAHAHFIRQVGEIKTVLESDGPSTDLLITTNETVLRWLLQHIRKVDTLLSAFLSQPG